MDTAALYANTASSHDGLHYRFEHPRIFDIINDMYIPAGERGPGDAIGSFDLPTTDGGRFTSADLAAGWRPTLIIFGSRTCPVTEDAVPGLRDLYGSYGEQVRFVMVQVREAHPGGTIGQPHTFAQKLRHAINLKAHHRLPFDVAVDDIDGTFHRRLGARPNSAYLIDPSGVIVFRAQWANETEAISDALHAVVMRHRPSPQAVTRTPHAIMRMLGHVGPVLDAAGAGARLDTWKVAPPMAMMMVVADALTFLPRRRRGMAAAALMIAATAALAGAIAAWLI